ncbi:hypothetical protein [Undibacterium curvum]|uniref:hypothetical protein n=1 Tax=Undibacterium curvum TaxID=2762294 RepID=UPI003D0A304A
MSVSSRFCVAMLLSAATPLLMAQNLYRCGNSYQDKPCDPGQKSQIIGTLPGNGNSGNPRAILDGECTRRGEEAKKIIWMREGGATQDALLADAKTEERRKLISDIYAQRGNSSDVRSAIEKDCMQGKTAAYAATGRSCCPCVSGYPCGHQRLRPHQPALRLSKRHKSSCAASSKKSASARQLKAWARVRQT